MRIHRCLVPFVVSLLILWLAGCSATLSQRIASPDPDRADAALTELTTLPPDEQVDAILAALDHLQAPEHERERRALVERLASTAEAQPALVATAERLLSGGFGPYQEPEFIAALARSSDPDMGRRLIERGSQADLSPARQVAYRQALADWAEKHPQDALRLQPAFDAAAFQEADADLRHDLACPLFEARARVLTTIMNLRPFRQKRLNAPQRAHIAFFLEEGPPACAGAALRLLTILDWQSLPGDLKRLVADRPDSLLTLPVSTRFRVLRDLLTDDIEPPAALTAAVLTAPEVADRQLGEVLSRLLPPLFSFHPDDARIEDNLPLTAYPLRSPEAGDAEMAAYDAILDRARRLPSRLVEWVDPAMHDRCPLALYLLDDPAGALAPYFTTALDSLKHALEIRSEAAGREAAWCLRGLRRHSAPAMAEWLLTHEDPVVRGMAIKLAAKAGHDAVLQQAVLDPEPAVRMHALQECCGQPGAATSVIYAYERYALPWTPVEQSLLRTGGFIAARYADLVTTTSGPPMTPTAQDLPSLEATRHCDALQAEIAAFGDADDAPLQMLEAATTTEAKQALLASLLRCAMVAGDLKLIHALTDVYRVEDIAAAHAAARPTASIVSLAAAIRDNRILPAILNLGFEHAATAVSPLFTAYDSCHLPNIHTLRALGHYEPPASFHAVLHCGLGVWEHVRRRGADVDGWSEEGPPLVRVAGMSLPDAPLKIRYLLNHGADPYAENTTGQTAFDRIRATMPHTARAVTETTETAPGATTAPAEITTPAEITAPVSVHPALDAAVDAAVAPKVHEDPRETWGPFDALLTGMFSNFTYPALAGCGKTVTLVDGVGPLLPSPGEGGDADPCATLRLSSLQRDDLTGDDRPEVLLHLTVSPVDGDPTETWLYVYRFEPRAVLLRKEKMGSESN